MSVLATVAMCVAFAAPPPDSNCRAADARLKWLNKPADAQVVKVNAGLDPLLMDPAFRQGVRVSGTQRFEIEGAWLVEALIHFANSDQYSYTLSWGAQSDRRFVAKPLRLGPSRRARVVPLLMSGGRGELRIDSDAPSYELVALRWITQEDFKQKVMSELLDRLRKLQADPFYENRRESRAQRMQELGEMAVLGEEGEALLQLTRAVYWIAAENHQPRDIERLNELLLRCLREMPQHPVVQQMASASCSGKNVGGNRPMARDLWCESVASVLWTPVVKEDMSGAPRWARAQWYLRARLEEITRWWVNERQRDNGEIGGGWGDDVEILRQWGPLALGLGSETASAGMRRMAEGLWGSGQLKDGYDRGISDVEHSSEPTTDTLGLLSATFPFDESVLAKLRQSSSCAYNWIVPQPDGMWRFRSSWFNCAEHDPKPERALDVHMNTRAMGPALWYAALTRDRKLIDLIAKWGESWRVARNDGRHGKPAGLFPPVLRSVDGHYLIGSEDWRTPQAEWDYFQWSPGVQESLEALFRGLYELTGDAKWRMGEEPAFDAPTASDLEREAEELDLRFKANFDMFTREVIYTDRVYYAMSPRYQSWLFGGEPPRGDRAPLFAVTWPAQKTPFARAVVGVGPDALKLRLYGLEDGEAQVRLWRLKPGRYQWSAGQRTGTFEVTRTPHDLALPLPAHQDLTVEIRAVNAAP